MSVENRTKTEVERASPIDRIMARRAAKHLLACVGSIDVIPVRPDLAVVWKPRREIAKRQSDLYGEYGKKDPILNYITPRSDVRVMRNREGAVGFYYGSSNSLEYRAHRFIVSSTGQLSYHREPFNVDSGAYPSEILDLTGTKSIAANKEALDELWWLEDVVCPENIAMLPSIGRIAVRSCRAMKPQPQ